jgi:Adenine-specific methyltransferase EcoRI
LRNICLPEPCNRSASRALEFDPDTFRGKVVYCNCDDLFESNFFKYFAANSNKLGLKKLVTTSYDGSPIAGAQLTFGEYDEGNGKRQKPKAIAVEIEEVKDVTGDGAIGPAPSFTSVICLPHHPGPLSFGEEAEENDIGSQPTTRQRCAGAR